jgi:hypothetical protein
MVTPFRPPINDPISYTFRFRSDIRGRRNTIRTYGRNPAAFFRFPIPTSVVKTVVRGGAKIPRLLASTIAAHAASSLKYLYRELHE